MRKAGAKKPAVGTKLRFTLSEPAEVEIAIERKTIGKKGKTRSGKKTCERTSKPPEDRSDRCTLYVEVGTLSREGLRGANSVAFTGRLGSRTLARRRLPLHRRRPAILPATTPTRPRPASPFSTRTTSPSDHDHLRVLAAALVAAAMTFAGTAQAYEMTWSETQTLSSTDQPGTAPVVAMNDKGQAVVAYIEPDAAGTNRVRVRYPRARPEWRLLRRAGRLLVGERRPGLRVAVDDPPPPTRRSRSTKPVTRSSRGTRTGTSSWRAAMRPCSGASPTSPPTPPGSRAAPTWRWMHRGTRSSATSSRSRATRGSNRSTGRRRSGKQLRNGAARLEQHRPRRARPGWPARRDLPDRWNGRPGECRLRVEREPELLEPGPVHAGRLGRVPPRAVRKRYGNRATSSPTPPAGRARPRGAQRRSHRGRGAERARCLSDGRHRTPPTAASTSSASPPAARGAPIRKPSRRSIRATTSRGTASDRRWRPTLRATSSRTGPARQPATSSTRTGSAPPPRASSRGGG